MRGETQSSGGLSAGAKRFVGEHLGFRLPYRFAATFLNMDGEMFGAGGAGIGTV